MKEDRVRQEHRGLTVSDLKSGVVFDLERDGVACDHACMRVSARDCIDALISCIDSSGEKGADCDKRLATLKWVKELFHGKHITDSIAVITTGVVRNFPERVDDTTVVHVREDATLFVYGSHDRN